MVLITGLIGVGGAVTGGADNQTMPVRVVTLNPEQGHKRWEARRRLIVEEIGRLKPDMLTFNEVSVPTCACNGACGSTQRRRAPMPAGSVRDPTLIWVNRPNSGY